MENYILHFDWTISKGRDTYGYNVVTLRCNGAKFSTCGGGYDMKGTVLGDWMAATFQAELLAVKTRASSVYSKKGGYQTRNGKRLLYGMRYNKDKKEITLDGACGKESMLSILEAIGYRLTMPEDAYNKRGGLKNHYVAFVSKL